MIAVMICGRFVVTAVAICGIAWTTPLSIWIAPSMICGRLETKKLMMDVISSGSAASAWSMICGIASTIPLNICIAPVRISGAKDPSEVTT